MRFSFACAFNLLTAFAALLAAGPLHAQYKVIGSDGKVTYTDRPPAEGKVTTIGARAAPATGFDAALPLELRQPASRYPVTLYVTAGDCEPCQTARQMLRQRGIPYAEKQIVSAEDSDALERLSGGRDAPTLAIGSQLLRGLAPDVWASYLDAAGYPRESRLPPSYQYAAATPLTERRDAALARTAAPARAAPDASGANGNGPRPVPPAAPDSIRF